MKRKLRNRILAAFVAIALIVSILPPAVEVQASSMSIGTNGLNLIKSFEGCRLYAYKATSAEKYYTIGWGHYGPDVLPGMRITQSQADNMLLSDLKKYVGYVNTFLSKYGISVNQNQFDALVSFTYNVGNVWANQNFTLKTYLINGVQNYSRDTIRTGFTNWNKQGGRVLNGLTRRRNAEADLFLGGVLPTPVPTQDPPTLDVSVASVDSEQITFRLRAGNCGLVVPLIRSRATGATQRKEISSGLSDFNFTFRTSSMSNPGQTFDIWFYYYNTKRECERLHKVTYGSDEPYTVVLPEKPGKYSAKEKEKLLDPLVFDVSYYKRMNGDLADMTDEKAKEHWLEYGVDEGRAASPLFESRYYLEGNSDVKDYYKGDYGKATLHFIDYGISEMRVGSILFNPQYYIQINTDVKKAYGNDKRKYYDHFRLYGMAEGRWGSKEFNPGYYKENYADLQATYGSDWTKYYQHYMLYGRNERRVADSRLKAKFNANGGMVKEQAREITAGSDLGTMPVPSYKGTGYQFDGWYTAKSGGYNVTGDTVPEIDGRYCRLYAHWSSTSIQDCSISLSKTEYTSDGTAKKPKVTVKDASGTNLTEGTHYTLKYSDNISAGTAAVTIKGVEEKGYSGTVRKEFTILSGDTGGTDDTGDVDPPVPEETDPPVPEETDPPVPEETGLPGPTGSAVPDDGPRLEISAENERGISGEDAFAAVPGGNVTVVLRIGKNPGICYLQMIPSYDTGSMELTGCDNGEVFSDPNAFLSVKKALWDSENNVTAQGKVLELDIHISEDAKEGTYPLQFKNVECYNGEEQDIQVEIPDVSITVKNGGMPGDVNGDASINGRDLIRLRKYLLMNGVEGPSGAVEISEGADVNQDGVVNGKDLISLRRKLMAM